MWTPEFEFEFEFELLRHPWSSGNITLAYWHNISGATPELVCVPVCAHASIRQKQFKKIKNQKIYTYITSRSTRRSDKNKKKFIKQILNQKKNLKTEETTKQKSRGFSCGDIRVLYIPTLCSDY